MTKSTTDKAAEDLGRTMTDGKVHAQETSREAQETGLKHEGDTLQHALDEATGAAGTPH